MRLSILITMLLACPLMGQAVVVETDPTTVSGILGASPAIHKGRVVLDGSDLRTSDGTNWLNYAVEFEAASTSAIATLATDSDNIGKGFVDTSDNNTPKIITALNTVETISLKSLVNNFIEVRLPGQLPVKYDIGTTEAEARTAFVTAEGTLINGSVITLPPMREFVIPDTTVAGSRIVFNGNWSYFRPQVPAGSNEVLRFIGNGIVVDSVRGDSIGATGQGRFLVSIGDDCRVSNVMVFGTDGTAANPIHTTGDRVTVTDVYTYQQNGGLLHDGGNYSLRNVICEDFGEPHAITSNTTIANANISYSNIKGLNNGRDPDNGFINLNSQIAEDARLGHVSYDNCHLTRPIVNHTLNISTFKISPARSVTFRNCTMDIGDFSGGSNQIHCLVFSDGLNTYTGTYHFDNIYVENCHFEGTFSGGGMTTRNMTMTGSTFDVRTGLKGLWCQSFLAAVTTIEKCRFLGCETAWFVYNTPYQSKFHIKDTVFDGPAGAGVFNLTGVGDLAGYKFDNVNLVSGIDYVFGSPNTSSMMAMKKDGTYDQFFINGPNTFPGTFSSGVSLSQGARLVNKQIDPANSFFDHAWNGSAWIALGTGNGTGFNVVKQADNVASDINTVNTYDTAAVFGADPAVSTESWFARVDLATGIKTEYFSNEAGNAWIEVPGATASSPNVRTITSSTTVLSTDGTILLDGSLNAVAASLPDASTVTGQVFRFKTVDVTNTTSVVGNGGDLIDASGTYTLSTLNEHLAVQSDGTNYKVFSSSTALQQAPVVYKTTGQQPEVGGVINSFETQSHVGPAPTPLMGQAYYTYARDTGTLNAYVAEDTDPGPGVTPAWDSVGSKQITTTYYEDLSDRPSPVTFVVGSQAVVFNDVGTPANNGTYTATGAAAGNLATTWTKN